MLDKEIFQERYNTTYSQMHPESFLETVSDEDKETYEEFEILSGKNRNGKVNKFNNFGKSNKGKKYNTRRRQLDAVLNKVIDGAIENDNVEKIVEKMIQQAQNGDFKQQQFLMERWYGKEPENINMKVEGDVTFEIALDDNSKKRQEDNLKEDDKISEN